MLEELEFEFDELLLDEFELELLEEFELEFDELFDDELDELFPATMIEPSLLAVFAPTRLTSGIGAEYCLASTAVVASAATPATSADFTFHCFVMAVTPLSGPSWRSGGGTGFQAVYSTRPGQFRESENRFSDWKCNKQELAAHLGQSRGFFFRRHWIAGFDRRQIGVERFGR